MDINAHKVKAMNEEKREAVINAALLEFCKGYKHASTDVIVKTAGISKGLLFHYFGSKKELLWFTYEFAMDIMMTEFIDKIDLDEPDFIVRLMKMMEMKLDLTFKYPAVFEFLGIVYQSTEEEVQDCVKHIQTNYEAAWDIDGQVFANIDTLLFKEGIDVKKAIEVVQLTCFGLSDRYLKQYETVAGYQAQAKGIVAEVKEYMEFFRQLLYK